MTKQYLTKKWIHLELGGAEITRAHNAHYPACQWRNSSKQGGSHIRIHSQFATILLVVWSANGDGSALTSKVSSDLLNYDTYLIVCAGNFVLSTQTNRARCALYKKYLIYLMKKVFLEKAVVELVLLIRREVLLRMFERVNRLEYD